MSGFRFVKDTTSNLPSVPSSGFMFSPDSCTLLSSFGTEARRRERAGPSAPFGEVLVLAELNQAGSSTGTPTITADGLEVIFSSDRAGMAQLYRAIRA